MSLYKLTNYLKLAGVADQLEDGGVGSTTTLADGDDAVALSSALHFVDQGGGNLDTSLYLEFLLVSSLPIKCFI